LRVLEGFSQDVDVQFIVAYVLHVSGEAAKRPGSIVATAELKGVQVTIA
jgi:hypothetical protein